MVPKALALLKVKSQGGLGLQGRKGFNNTPPHASLRAIAWQSLHRTRIYFVENEKHRPLNCRGGCYFWLDPKVTKRSSQQRGFFAAPAFALQIRQNLGCKQLPRFATHLSSPSANICYALQPHCPPLFYLISPEAFLLTERGLFFGLGLLKPLLQKFSCIVIL